MNRVLIFSTCISYHCAVLQLTNDIIWNYLLQKYHQTV